MAASDIDKAEQEPAFDAGQTKKETDGAHPIKRARPVPVPRAAAPPRRPSPVMRKAGFLLATLVAGFLGAWLFSYTSLANHSPSTTIKESKERVLAEGEVVSDVAKSVSPSVVSIVTKSTATNSFYGSVAQEGAGTGVIISKDGYVLTNKHVIPDSIQSLSVVMADGKTYDSVTVVGRDPINDLAFLKINDVSNLTPATLGSSSNIAVGQKVVAIGNALGQYHTTVTSGIISGIGRPVTAGDATGSETESLSNLLQTDAAINPGNSGGPLVNLNNEVIGINVAVASEAQGIGFAIPIDDAKGLIESVLATGKVSRPYIGVQYVMLDEGIADQLNIKQTSGAYVGPGNGPAVVAGSPAEKAGLQSGDIITKVNNTTLSDTVSLVSQVAKYKPGDIITLTVIRDGKERQVKVTLDTYGG